MIAANVAAQTVAPFTWQVPIEVATGRGERGPWQQNASRYDHVDDPAVAISEHGDIALAWVDQARKAVLFQRYSASGKKQFAQAVNVSRSPAVFSWLPRVVLTPGQPQRVSILWQEIIFSGGSHGGEMFFAQSDDGGATFSVPVNLSKSVNGDGKGRITQEVWHNGSFDLIAAGNGALYAAWTEYDGALWFAHSADGSKNFSSPQRIAGDNLRPARAPSLAFEADRTVYLAWTLGEDPGADIHVAQSSDNGATFGPAVRVAPSSQYSDAPRLLVDRHGVLHLVYAESRGGPFERHDIHYTSSLDGARSFATPRVISEPAPWSITGAGFPAIGADAEDTLYVMWELYQGSDVRPRGLGLVVLQSGEEKFTEPQAVPHSRDRRGGSNGSQQGLLMKKLAVSAHGHMAIVNSSLQRGQHSRVWLMRGHLKR